MTRALVVLALLPRLALAAACCVGGNPKSFISLSRLQTYEVGVSTSARDVYGEYNQYGELESSRQNQTLTLLFGAGMRFTPDLQASVTLPFAYQRMGNTRAGLGDAIVGAQYTLVESLFADEWYPTVTLLGGVRVPTGNTESIVGGKILPATGVGYWEPYAGVGLAKTYGAISLGLRASYGARISRADAVELMESFSYLFNEQLSVAVGLTQNWTLDDTRGAGAFIAPTYFLTRYLSVGGGFDFSLPFDRAGVNSQAARAVTLTAKYGFY